MNKGVIIGVIITAVIVAGAIVLAQDDESDTSVVIDIENSQTEPKSFSIDLQEDIGMAEKP